MQHEISYECSPELLRQATRRFILTYAGPGLVAFGIAAALAFVGVSAGKETVFCWGVIIAWAVHGLPWLKFYNASVSKYDEMPDRKVGVRVEPEGMTFQTSLYTSTVKWAGLQKMWIYPDLLMLFYSKSLFSVLPAASVGEDMLDFIQQKIREHGGKVVTRGRSKD